MRSPALARLTPSPNLTGGVALREDRAYKGLTAQQWAYCEHRAAGMSIVDAYRTAYEPTSSNADQVRQNACAVEARPIVQARLREMLFEKQGAASLVPQIGRDFVLTGIANEAVTAQRPADRLRAYELLGKSIGLFQPEREIEATPKSVEELDRQIKARLAAALAPTIDETAKDVTPTSRGVQPGADLPDIEQD